MAVAVVIEKAAAAAPSLEPARDAGFARKSINEPSPLLWKSALRPQ